MNVSDAKNEIGRPRLLVRLDYLKELMSVQIGLSEKSILEVADVAEKLEIHPGTVKSIRGLASVITGIKDGLANIVIMIKNLKGGDDDSRRH